MAYDNDISIHKAHHAMLVIQALDPTAHLEFSGETGKWWISSRIGIGGDGFMTGILYCHVDANEAVMGYLVKLQSVVAPKYVAVNDSVAGVRPKYRWNGAAFARVPVDKN